MIWNKTIGAMGLGLLLSSAAFSQQPVLQLQGQPYFGGSMTLHVTAPGSIGQLVTLAIGLNPLPLDTPANSSKGSFYIGNLTSVFALGAIAGNGRLDLPFTMPPLIPGAEGIPIVMQAYVAPQLSNPATLNLDLPYLLPQNAYVINHPLPSTQALFGDRLAAGDFNGDGTTDLAVSAWFEKIGVVGRAGRVYVFWGPDLAVFTVLSPAVPKYFGVFGLGLMTTDVDGDSIDDLVVAEASGGDPPTPGAHGALHVFRGGSFSTTPWKSITSVGTAIEAQIFGRVSAAGDIDGDSFVDFIIGTPEATVSGHFQAGRIEVYRGPAYNVATLLENPEPKTDDFFGSRVDLGDVTGDGLPDIIESSGRAKVNGVSQAGRLHVYDGPTQSLLATIDNPAPVKNDRFGEGLREVDLDGDTLGEILVADVKNRFFIIWNPLTATMSALSKPPSPNPQPGVATDFGYQFESVDVNMDGMLDVAIADPTGGDLLGCGLLGAGGSIYVALAPYFASFRRLVSPFPHCGDDFSWSLTVSDVAGNGAQAVLAGNDTADLGAFQNAGQVVVVVQP